MATTSYNDNIGVLLRLTPEDIRTIRRGLRVLLQIHTRKEGYGAIRRALADLPDEESLAQCEIGEELQTLAFACRAAGLCGDEAPRTVEAAEGLPRERPATNTPAPATRKRVTLAIVGFACGGGGALTVERALQRIAGVRCAYVNPATEMAYVEYDPRETGLDSLEEVIRSLGYRTEDGEA